MQLVVIGTDEMVSELIAQGVSADLQVCAIQDFNDVMSFPAADAYLDLLFDSALGRINTLRKINKPVIINSVIKTLGETAPSFCRINGWPTFLRAPLIEASALTEELKTTVSFIFQQLNREVEWLPDDTGFITPRVVSAIVNEAYFALAEEVSTKKEIDTAMKLGTAYPFGPFEWSQKIGLHKIAALLNELSVDFPRYTPAPLLLKEAELAAV